MAATDDSDPGPRPADGPTEVHDDEFDYDRTVALSDGVFAIALTLLVLNIPQPSAGGDLWDKLGDTLPDLGAYALSFAVIAALWRHHHTFVRGLSLIDGRLTTLNLIYLGCIALIPFPTGLLAERGSESAAVIVYAGALAATTGAGALMRVYADRRGLAPARHASMLWWLATPGVFLASIPIALLSPQWGTIAWLALIPIGILEDRHRMG